MGSGLKPRRPVFSCRGSLIIDAQAQGINVSAKLQYLDGPRHEKTNNVVSEKV